MNQFNTFAFVVGLLCLALVVRIRFRAREKYMKLFCLFLLLPLFSCAQPKEDLSERALELCPYIPDHGLNPEARDVMTPDFFQTLSEAFDAPVVDYGEIGNNEWLWYFVTGNDAATPEFTVKSLSIVDPTHAVATIAVQNRSDITWELFGEIAKYPIEMVRVGGQWLLDDFDGKKAECVDFIKEMRAKYKSGELLEYMESEDYLHEYIPDFKRRVEEYYRKYGTE